MQPIIRRRFLEDSMLAAATARGFTNAAVLEKHPSDSQALAETVFEHCLFASYEPALPGIDVQRLTR